MARGKADGDLYGLGILGESLAPKKGGALAERFGVPPFSVLNAREGLWQDRKRAWLSLGIKSELGRGETLDAAAPGGSAMPATNYSKSGQRGTGTGAAVEGTQKRGLQGQTDTPTPDASAQAPKTPATPQIGAISAVQAPEPDPFAGIEDVPLTSFKAAGVTAQVSQSNRQGAAGQNNAGGLGAKPGAVEGPVASNAQPPALAEELDELPLTDFAGASAPESNQGLVDPFLAFHAATLEATGDGILTFDEAAWDYEDKSAITVDVECFINFFLVCARRISTGARIAFEFSERCPLDKENLRRLLAALVVTFNGNHYDIVMIRLALTGASLEQLKGASDRIIQGGLTPWQMESNFSLASIKLNHVDLLEPNPSVRQGLKMLGARLHTRFLVDLPFPPNAWLSFRDMNVTTLYCMNDLDVTDELFAALKEPYELRRAISNEYRVDMRSKSDAQIGEAIIKFRYEKLTGQRVSKPNPKTAYFSYDTPSFIKFSSPRLNNILGQLRGASFHSDPGGNVKPPSFLANLKIPIGNSVYTMGIGGLHSTEAHRAIIEDADTFIEDIDVASQYPFIILKLGLYPEALGASFLDAYRQIVDERIAAKKAGQKVKAEGLKISVNGIYGKLGSSFSFLYAPHLMIAVTLTGQLSLLMLIERLEAVGISVVSGNTDGVVIQCPYTKEAVAREVVEAWEAETEFNVERKRYKGIYNSSVNSYMAIGCDGSAKRKGPIADPWTDNDKRGQLMKNPQMTICSDAVLKFIKDGTPIEQTIRACRDPRMFVTTIRVSAGGSWCGHNLGKVVRYYWALNGAPITYSDGRKVAKTAGAYPLMELTQDMPPGIDFERYIEEAKKIAVDIAAIEEQSILTKRKSK